MDIYIFIAAVAGIIIGAVGGYLAARIKSVSLATLLDARAEEGARMAERLAQNETAMSALRQELSVAKADNSALRERVDSMGEFHKAEMESRRREFDEQMKTVRESLQNTTQEFLERKTRALGEENSRSVEAILKPVREKMEEMRKEVEATRERSVSNTASLETHIKAMMEQAVSMGREADRLTNALTRRIDLQGDWGEMILETLLEKSGLHEGDNYDRQYTLRDADEHSVRNEEGHKMKPDIVVHFPDNKDVVIDSKVSLTAYYDYCNAVTEEDKERALKAHVESIKRQVAVLSRKNYSSYIGKGRQALEYVIMFVPIDSALQLAVLNDRKLWQESFEKGVFITSEQNLMLMLRLVSNAWSQEMQCRNQEQVYKVAANLLDRIADFDGYLKGVDKGLDAARRSYAEAYSKLVGGGQSISVSARQLVQLGAKAKNRNKAERLQTMISACDEAVAELADTPEVEVETEE